MFPTPLSQLINRFSQQLSQFDTRFVLVYVDTVDVRGQLAVRLSSNYDQAAIPGLLGSLLEPGLKLREMLTELFRAHPLRVPAPPVDPANPPEPDATPVLVEVPLEEAVEMVCTSLLTNLQLRGVKQPSPIIALG